jgi:MFS family permease
MLHVLMCPLASSDGEKNAVLSSFYWGYTAAMLPSGLLVQRYGGHSMMGVALGISSLLTALLPLVASTAVGVVCVFRALTGIAEASCFPAGYDVLSRWVPSDEQSSSIGLSFGAGEQLGAILGFGITGILCDRVGWKSAFYFFGLVGGAAWVFWMTLCSNNPACDRFISEEECAHILSMTGGHKSSAVSSPLNEGSGRDLSEDLLKSPATEPEVTNHGNMVTEKTFRTLFST